MKTRVSPLQKSTNFINKVHISLVYPFQNDNHIPSLWHHFYPRSQMRWAWDEDADNRVSKLWILREELSRSKKVVYTKWYRNRATFISKEFFPYFLKVLALNPELKPLTSLERDLLDLVLLDSPISSKKLRKLLGLSGKFNDSLYQKTLQGLWDRFLIVGFGEVDDGAFPSLAIGATKHLFEEQWKKAEEISFSEAKEKLCLFLEKNPKFNSYFKKQYGKLKRDSYP